MISAQSWHCFRVCAADMPIDINLLREGRGGDPEAVRESQRRRFASVELVDQVRHAAAREVFVLHTALPPHSIVLS